MSRVVMDGVAFALKDCMQVALKNGIILKSTTLCGGGQKSKEWRQIIADVLGIKIKILETEQGPSYGSAILA